MLKYPEVRLALTDVRTGERDLWQKYKSKMEQAEQKLEEIQHIINVEVKQNPDYRTDYARIAYEAFSKIIQKCEEK